MTKNEMKRLEMRIPGALLEHIDQYKNDKMHVTRTAAILELLRIGLDQQDKNKK